MNKEGLIIKGVGGIYTVLSQGESYACTAKGVFRNRDITPLVGDSVEISVMDEAKKIATLHTINPRTNQLRRPAAANISQVIITIAAAEPPFNPGLLDRLLLLVEDEDIPILICVNKRDLGFRKSMFEPYEQAGYEIVYTQTIGDVFVEDLRQAMSGKLNLFAGPSGVGKSSLINALIPNLQLETGGLSKKISRGKHTTRHTEIFPLGATAEAGYCFDTPGFTALDISHIKKENLGYLYREFRLFIPDCKFANCLHHKEIDCAVKANVGKAIHPERHESYLRLLKNEGKYEDSNR